MTYDNLRSALRRTPFEPFRIVTSDGTVYDIRHPDLVYPMLGAALIGFPDPAGREDVAARYDIVALTHIVRFEQLLQASGGE